jgi:hypothetical protein
LLGESTRDPLELRRAVEATFARRKMAMPSSLPAGLGDAFMTDTLEQSQWTSFLKRNRLDAIALANVATRLRGALGKAGIF